MRLNENNKILLQQSLIQVGLPLLIVKAQAKNLCFLFDTRQTVRARTYTKNSAAGIWQRNFFIRPKRLLPVAVGFEAASEECDESGDAEVVSARRNE